MGANVMWTGNISLNGNLYTARQQLRNLGFEITGPGKIVIRSAAGEADVSEFPVRCTTEVLEGIDHLFGQMIWSLQEEESENAIQ